jgi:HAD superfamily hydrolase (TIGR01484 family)
MISEELLNNYQKALQQKYNAVCFDIDGTLTEDNSTKIDSRVLPMLANMLKKHIPVVFITGRGETGLSDLLKDILYDLKSKYGVTEKQLQKMYALTNDGARIFMTSNGSKQLFNINEYISSKEELIKLDELNKKIITLLDSAILKGHCKITYSVDSNTNAILNIRLIILNNNLELGSQIIQIINSLIRDLNNSNLNLTIGMHNGKQVLQIGTATKDKAIQVAERIIGIPQNSMLRIGDCGDQFGNDYSMLNYPQGFSVDKTSGAVDKCFPVIENGKIITGINGTLALLKKAKLLPTICLEHAIESEYAREYAKTEKKMTQGKNHKIIYFNDLINNKFQTVDGIASLFDSSSGSIKIPMYEWITISDNNPLKQLYLTCNDSSLHYSMYDNENILLRGSGIYYYFLSQRIHDENTREDITTKEMVYEWLNNNMEFLSKSLIAINNTLDINDLNNTKMILGVIDNIRNYLLILLNQQIVNNQIEKNIMVNFETLTKDSLIYKLYNGLISAENLMKNISFNENYKINSIDLEKLIKDTILITNEFRVEFIKQSEKENYSKDFRAYREIDNFAENFITCSLTLQKDSNIFNKGICGLCYGGLELPIIMKSIDDRINDVSILKFNKNVTGYAKKQSLELRFFDIFKTGGIELFGIDKQMIIY